MNFNRLVKIVFALALAAVSVTILCALMMMVLVPWPDLERRPYSDGVAVWKWEGEYVNVTWDCENEDRPTACPLTVHFAGVDYDPARLGSPDRLRRDGWTNRVYEDPQPAVRRDHLESPGQVVRCWYHKGRLTGLTVDTTRAKALGGVAVTYDGRRVDLPCTEEVLTRAFGCPLRPN